jgi:succinate dehydrogenase / fumarate reductase membrane anchor subunit
MSETDIPSLKVADARAREPKSAEFKTPLKRVRHYGAAGHGVEHFIAQKASALALIVLLPLFLGGFALAARGGSDSLVAWLSSPPGALVSLLFFGAACFHMRIGIATIVEDYLHGAGRYVCLLANTFIAIVLWAAVSLSILFLAFGG